MVQGEVNKVDYLIMGCCIILDVEVMSCFSNVCNNADFLQPNENTWIRKNMNIGLNLDLLD